MSDPLGLIGAAAGSSPTRQPSQATPSAPAGGPSFRDALLSHLNEVNRLQQEATQAAEDLAAGRRTDLEGVLLAAQKADLAFRALQAVRNKVVEAYQEVQRMSV